MKRSLICAYIFTLVSVVLSKPPEGENRDSNSEGFHPHHPDKQQQQQHLTGQRHGFEHGQLATLRLPFKDTREGQPVPLHDVNRVRGIYIDGKPVVAGLPQSVPLTSAKAQAEAQHKSPAYETPFAGGEYYEDLPPYSGPQSAYIPTAPYPASIYGRPPFWVRLQRWNPFSRFYRSTFAIGGPSDYSPPYGYVVPPLMVLPTAANSKIEPFYSQQLGQASAAQRRYSIF